MKYRDLRAGDAVRVRSADEILATLDAGGMLEGVPFMPEMVDACDRTFRVLRRVEKTCVDGFPMRCFPGSEVFILDSARCDGAAHEGCKRGCRIFWKREWLAPAESDDAPRFADLAASERLRGRLRVKADAEHYFCQSTELFRATREFTGSRRLLTVRIALREVRAGDLSVMRAIALLSGWITQRWLRKFGADERLRGRGRQTTNPSLGFKPGDRVRVKPRADVAATLNEHMRNRGLSICYEMTRCCGRKAEVRQRIDRIIDERTGLMRELANTVALKNVGRNNSRLAEECLCKGQLGDCPRGELMYWRESWLEKQ
jgi:hypothetical protein